MNLDINIANDYFSDMMEGLEWEKHGEEERQRAINTAWRQIKTLNFKSKEVLEEENENIKEAVYFQALFLLQNPDGTSHELNRKNGLQGVGLAGYTIAYGKGAQKIKISIDAMSILRPYIRRMGRL